MRWVLMVVIHFTDFKSQFMTLLVPFSFLSNFLLLSLTVHHNNSLSEVFPKTSNLLLLESDDNLPSVHSGNTSIFSVCCTPIFQQCHLLHSLLFLTFFACFLLSFLFFFKSPISQVGLLIWLC